MTTEQIHWALDEITRSLRQRFPNIKFPLTRLDDSILNPDDEQLASHLLWMVKEITYMRFDKIDKAFRWLGFIQGCIVARGWGSISEAKEQNRPKREDA